MIKIYRIINKSTSETVYIGSTSRTLEKRFKEHLNDFLRPDKQTYLKENDCFISLICECEVEERKDMENKYIKLFQSWRYFNIRLEINDKDCAIHKFKKEEKLKENIDIAKNI